MRPENPSGDPNAAPPPDPFKTAKLSSFSSFFKDMPANSDFQQAIQAAQRSALVGPNVLRKALPVVGGGMVLTAAGVMGGMALLASNPALFMPLFLVALIGNFILFFVAQNVAMKGNNSTALPLLTTYSLLTGFTLSGIVVQAQLVAGAGAIATAAVATGITFILASVFGRRMSDDVGQALSGVVGLGIVGLLIAMVVQLVGGLFFPGFGGGGFELMIAGFGTVLFIGAAFVDFYTMPRTYTDDQYLAGALGMYLTYINLFIFILRLIIAINGGGRRE